MLGKELIKNVPISDTEWLLSIGDGLSTTDDFGSVNIHITQLPNKEGSYCVISKDTYGVSTAYDLGIVIIRLDNDGNIIWKKEVKPSAYDIYAGTASSDSAVGYLTNGNCVLIHDDDVVSNDCVITILNKDTGSVVLSKTLTLMTGVTYANTLLVDTDDTIYVAGKSDTYDKFIAKYDSSLNLVWIKSSQEYTTGENSILYMINTPSQIFCVGFKTLSTGTFYPTLDTVNKTTGATSWYYTSTFGTNKLSSSTGAYNPNNSTISCIVSSGGICITSSTFPSTVVGYITINNGYLLLQTSRLVYDDFNDVYYLLCNSFDKILIINSDFTSVIREINISSVIRTISVYNGIVYIGVYRTYKAHILKLDLFNFSNFGTYNGITISETATPTGLTSNTLSFLSNTETALTINGTPASSTISYIDTNYTSLLTEI